MSGVSVIDVARKCGVSPSTVCRALNKKFDISVKTREKILQACGELGYTKNTAASNLRLKTSNVIACLMTDAANELSVEKRVCLKNEVLQSGYVWRWYGYSSKEEKEAFLDEIISSRPSGIIISGGLSSHQVQLIKKNKIPMVCYDSEIEGFDSVTLDRTKGYYEATKYLIEQGREKILLLGAKLDSERGLGYQLAHKECQKPLNSALVIDLPFGPDLFAYGYEQIKRIAGNLSFDGIVAVNDATAMGAICALSELNLRIPQDVAVIGADNIMASAYTTPPMTTVAQPKEELAKFAVDFLINRIKNYDTPTQVQALASQLLIRNST